MRKNLVPLFASLAALAFAACGGGGGDSSESACDAVKIAGGETCSASTSPVVQLTIDGSAFCSASIISPTALLSAAHCVQGARSIQAFHAGAQETVRRAYYSNLYPGGVDQYDVAVLEVSSGFTSAAGVAPLPLLTSQAPDSGATVALSGYGVNQDGELDLSSPKAAFLTFTQYDQGLIVADDQTGVGRPGDSGGPLVYQNAQWGVFSGFVPDGTTNFFASVQNPDNFVFIQRYARGIQTASSSNQTAPGVVWTAAE